MEAEAFPRGKFPTIASGAVPPSKPEGDKDRLFGSKRRPIEKADGEEDTKRSKSAPHKKDATDKRRSKSETPVSGSASAAGPSNRAAELSAKVRKSSASVLGDHVLC